MTAPRAFGYVRVGSRHKARVERWRVRIAEYCVQEGLALELVFADRAVRDTELVRPGWTALLDVLDLTASQMVIVPSEDHLSGDPSLRAELHAQLAAAGARALVMPPARVRTRHLKTDEASRS